MDNDTQQPDPVGLEPGQELPTPPDPPTDFSRLVTLLEQF